MYSWQSVIIHYLATFPSVLLNSDLNCPCRAKTQGHGHSYIFPTTAKLTYVPAKHNQSVPDLIRDAPVRFVLASQTLIRTKCTCKTR